MIGKTGGTYGILTGIDLAEVDGTAVDLTEATVLEGDSVLMADLSGRSDCTGGDATSARPSSNELDRRRLWVDMIMITGRE